MKRSMSGLLLLLLAAALAACGGGANAPAPTTESFAGAVTPQAAQPTVTQPTEVQPPTVVPQTTPVAAATPDIQKIVNPQPDDWKRGPDGAKLTIIEWGDFQ